MSTAPRANDHHAKRLPAADLAPRPLYDVDWLGLIRAEYKEFPGLQLTAQQARRLWNLDPHTCDTLLADLVGQRFLRRTRTRAYTRAD